jgi:hypothetical protein
VLRYEGDKAAEAGLRAIRDSTGKGRLQTVKTGQDHGLLGLLGQLKSRRRGWGGALVERHGDQGMCKGRESGRRCRLR